MSDRVTVATRITYPDGWTERVFGRVLNGATPSELMSSADVDVWLINPSEGTCRHAAFDFITPPPTIRWDKEFPPEFTPPPAILSLVARRVLEDTSWHNDTCPSFVGTTRDGVLVKLFCDAADPFMREDEEWPRYVLGPVDDDGTMAEDSIYEGDDLGEVLCILDGVEEVVGAA